MAPYFLSSIIYRYKYSTNEPNKNVSSCRHVVRPPEGDVCAHVQANAHHDVHQRDDSHAGDLDALLMEARIRVGGEDESMGQRAGEASR